MIVNFWPTWFRQLYGGDWPQDYCCIDVETSGYSFDKDVITQWGHCLVQDGRVVDRLSLIIDWTEHPVVPDHWLRSRLLSVEQSMELVGKRCHINYQRMQDEGMKPDKALSFIRDFTDTLKRKGTLFVAHGGIFDEKMLSANMTGFKIAPGFTFGDNGLMDTEGIEKASQCLTDIRMYPKRDDTLRTYFHRVKYSRVAGCKSNMDEHCYTKYRFKEKHGIDVKDLHCAMVDSYCCHILMQQFASEITEPKAPPIFPTEDHKGDRKPSGAQPAKAPEYRMPPGARVRRQRNS